MTKFWFLALLMFAGAASAQKAKFEVTPLVGGRFGGTLGVRGDPAPSDGSGARADARLKDAVTYGIAAGVRYDSDWSDACEGCSLVEFRWMRTKTQLILQDPQLPIATPFVAGLSVRQAAMNIDHFLGDFTHEWSVGAGSTTVRPFVTASLGAARLSAPAGTKTRFEFGLGTGFKVLTKRHFGFRFHIEYLPVVMSSDLQRIVCGGAGGCIVAVSGGVMNQFQIHAGPIFRF